MNGYIVSLIVYIKGNFKQYDVQADNVQDAYKTMRNLQATFKDKHYALFVWSNERQKMIATIWGYTPEERKNRRFLMRLGWYSSVA